MKFKELWHETKNPTLQRANISDCALQATLLSQRGNALWFKRKYKLLVLTGWSFSHSGDWLTSNPHKRFSSLRLNLNSMLGVAFLSLVLLKIYGIFAGIHSGDTVKDVALRWLTALPRFCDHFDPGNCSAVTPRRDTARLCNQPVSMVSVTV